MHPCTPALVASSGFLSSMLFISFCIYIGTTACGFLIGWYRNHKRLLAFCRHASPAEIVERSEATYKQVYHTEGIDGRKPQSFSVS
jgi:hypothetical protein